MGTGAKRTWYIGRILYGTDGKNRTDRCAGRHVSEVSERDLCDIALVEPVPVMQEIVKAIAESGLLKSKRRMM